MTANKYLVTRIGSAFKDNKGVPQPQLFPRLPLLLGPHFLFIKAGIT